VVADQEKKSNIISPLLNLHVSPKNFIKDDGFAKSKGISNFFNSCDELWFK
jgi:hypothetical protein